MEQKKLWPGWVLITAVVVVMAVVVSLILGEWWDQLALGAFFIWFYPVYWKINRWIDAQKPRS